MLRQALQACACGELEYQACKEMRNCDVLRSAMMTFTLAACSAMLPPCITDGIAYCIPGPEPEVLLVYIWAPRHPGLNREAVSPGEQPCPGCGLSEEAVELRACVSAFRVQIVFLLQHQHSQSCAQPQIGQVSCAPACTPAVRSMRNVRTLQIDWWQQWLVCAVQLFLSCSAHCLFMQVSDLDS